MAITVNLVVIDLPGFFATEKMKLSGMLFQAPGQLIELVSPAEGSQTLTFTGATSPPAGRSWLHVIDNNGVGDIFRSGETSGWPASPATLTVITAGNFRFTPAEIIAEATKALGSTLTIPVEAQVAAGFGTASLWVPSSLSISSITAGASPLSFVVTGTLFYSTFFINTSSPFTFNISLAILPSGNSTNQNKIVSVRSVGASLSPGVLPAILLPLPEPVMRPIVANIMAPIIAGEVENAVNATILTRAKEFFDSQTTGQLKGARLSPTASINIRRVTTTRAGIGLQALISDLFGPAVVFPTPAMSVIISPTPVAGVAKDYHVHVRETATGNAVAGATVKLTNRNSRGTVTVSSSTTGTGGETTFRATLKNGQQRRIVTTGGRRETVVTSLPPLLNVTKPGFKSVEIALLGPDDIP